MREQIVKGVAAILGVQVDIRRKKTDTSGTQKASPPKKLPLYLNSTLSTWDQREYALLHIYILQEHLQFLDGEHNYNKQTYDFSQTYSPENFMQAYRNLKHPQQNEVASRRKKVLKKIMDLRSEIVAKHYEAWSQVEVPSALNDKEASVRQMRSLLRQNLMEDFLSQLSLNAHSNYFVLLSARHHALKKHSIEGTLSQMDVWSERTKIRLQATDLLVKWQLNLL